MDDYFLLPVQGFERSVRIFYDQLVLATKLSNYIRYHHLEQDEGSGSPKSREYYVKLTVKDCHLLKLPEFMTVNRGVIINRKHVVDCYQAKTASKQLHLLMSNGMTVAVSKTHIKKVREIYFPHGKIKAKIPD